jgi:hypothetical protein
VKQAVLDSLRRYVNALRHGDTEVVDEVRRWVQQDTLGRRGHKDDPLQDPEISAGCSGTASST